MSSPTRRLRRATRELPGDHFDLRAVSGALLWRLSSDDDNFLEGYIAHCGPWGVEYRLFLDGRFTFSQRFSTQEAAVEALNGRRDTDYLPYGWQQVYPPTLWTGSPR